MSDITFKTNIRGVKQTARQLDMIAAQLRNEVGRALREVMEGEILPDAVENCPVDTGALKRSGYVDGPRISGLGATVLIGFGKPDVIRPATPPGSLTPNGWFHSNPAPTSDYALRQHETHPTDAKWLERAVMDGAEKIRNAIRDRVGPNLLRVGATRSTAFGEEFTDDL